MSAVDLHTSDLGVVQQILKAHLPADAKVWVFGSRATWTTKDGSDLDLAIDAGRPLTRQESIDLTEAFDESSLAYKVDVVDLHTVTDSFKAIIDRDKVALEGWAGTRRDLGQSGVWDGGCKNEQTKISDVSLFLNRGVTPAYIEKDGIPVINQKCIRNGCVDLEKIRRTDQNKKYINNEKYIKIYDILVNSTGVGTLGRVGQIMSDIGEATVDSHVTIVRPNGHLIDPIYLGYIIKYLQPNIEALAEGSTGQTELSRDKLGQLTFPNLPRAQQVQIVVLLKSLDDRITLLREANKTLEAMAQAIFKDWFVDFNPVRAKMEGRPPEGMDAETAALFPDAFEESEIGLIPTGWNVGTLGDVATTSNRKLSSEELHSGLSYVGLEHMPRHSLSLLEWDDANGLESAKAVFSKGEVLFGKLRPYFHKVIIAPFDGVCSTDILVCQPKTDAYKGMVTMHLYSDALIEYADRLSNGAKMPRISWKDIAAYKVALPLENISIEYTKIFDALANKMLQNINTSRTLRELRDTLLPRLISGRLRLEETPQPQREG